MLLLGVSFNSSAQKVISVAGTHFYGTAGSLNWTLGEPVIKTFTASNGTLSQGFHQTYPKYPPCDTITVTFNVIDVLCFGYANGSISVSPSGGNTPYTYLWNTSQTTNSIIGLSPGNYYLTITDSLGCTANDSAVITQPDTLQLTVSGTQMLVCFGDTTGTAEVSVIGGTTPYTYLWNTGVTGNTLQGVSANTYTVTVTDANNCTGAAGLTISESSLITGADNISICTGDSVYLGGNWQTAAGSYYDTLTATNGCDSVLTTMLAINPTYNTSDTVTICSGDSIFLQGAYQSTAGIYYDTLTSVNGCDSIIATTLTVNQNNGGTILSDDTICSGNNGDTLLLVGYTGSILWWEFSTDGGATWFIINNTTAALLYNNLTATTKYRTAVQSGVCPVQYSTTATITVNPLPNATISPSLPAICQGNSIILTASGGGTYMWSTSEITTSITVSPSSTTSYIVTVTLNGCTNMISISVTVNPNPSLSIITTTDNGTGNGTADLTVTNGTPPYNFTWSNGATTQDISGLAAGTYSVTVADASGCSGTATANVNSLCSISLTITTTPAICGQSDGTASVSVSGGAPPYTYQWTSGHTSSLADSLTAGQYLVTVTDAAGCKPFVLAIVSNTNAPAITVNSITDANCYGSSDGAIDIGVSGGSPPYTYSWSNGAVTQDISGLQAGPYQVAVEDNNACITIMDITISQPSLLTVSIVISNASCGNSDGTAAASPSGGISPYTFSWSNGQTGATATSLVSGNYSLTVTDANGCMKIKQVTVNETGAPVITLDSVINSSCGSTTGDIWVTVSTGVPPYTYLWSNGFTSVPLLNVQSGIYSLTVTGSNGCKAAYMAEVQSLLPQVQLICLATVDSITMRNKVVWEKPVLNGISHFNIYKESTVAGVYFLAGSVPYDSISELSDPLSDPIVRSWRYRMTMVDSCSNESPVSVTHKTIHLVLSNFGTSNYLIWDDYEGFPVFTYYIHRYHPSTGWMALDSIASTLHSYTDLAPPSQGSTWYFVEAKHPDGCTATQKIKNYNTSLSNTSSSKAPIGLEEKNPAELEMILFPNPTNSEVTISYSLPTAAKVLIEITDVPGKKIVTLANNEKQVPGKHTFTYKFNDPGVYFIMLKTEEGVVVRKQISL